jgi:hypothetical protein
LRVTGAFDGVETVKNTGYQASDQYRFYESR